MRNSKIGAFFDLDKTLIKSNLFILFVKYKIRKNKINILSLMYLLPLYAISKIIGNNKFIRYGMYVNSLWIDKNEVSKEWSRYFNNNLLNFINEDLLKEIELFKKNGTAIFLITNNLDFIVFAIDNKLNFNKIICFKTATNKHGKVNQVEKFENLSINKAAQVKELARTYDIDIDNSYGFGDSKEDFEFLELLGNSFLVTEDGVQQFSSKINSN